MAWTSPRTWLAGETVTAALLNTHVRDNQLAMSTWATDWTPSWTAQTSNPSVGNGTLLGRYIQIGDLVHFYAQLTAGSTTSFGSGAYNLDLPVPPAARLFTFNGAINDASAGYYPLFAVYLGTGSDIAFRVEPSTAGNQARIFTATQPVTLTTSDQWFIGGTYEAA